MNNYQIVPIRFSKAKEFILAHHYSKGCHNGASPTYGLFKGNLLVGVCMFATPCSENVRASIFGIEEKHRVIELHRLALIDGLPTNTASWFISRCIKLLRKDKDFIRAIVSFADSSEGHLGIIYQALNFWFYGKTSKRLFYRDSTGRLRHPRQNGVNIKKQEAIDRGWTCERREGKYRYLLFVGGNKEKRFWKKGCKQKISKDYPK